MARRRRVEAVAVEPPAQQELTGDDDEALAELSKLSDSQSEEDLVVASGDEIGEDPEPEPGPETKRSPSPWGQVIQHVYDLDIKTTYRRLNEELTLGERATDYGQVLAALDHAAQNALTAVRLVRAAKLEDERVDHENREREEVMRSQARVELESEKAEAKAKGGAAKAPTLQEVEDRMIAHWPDELASIRRTRSEMHGAFRVIEGLEKAWWERCAALRKMAERYAVGRG